MAMNEYKETKAQRRLRIEETENGRKFRERIVKSKKIYNRKTEKISRPYLFPCCSDRAVRFAEALDFDLVVLELSPERCPADPEAFRDFGLVALANV